MSSMISIHEDTNVMQRVDTSVYQRQESTKRQPEMCVDVESMTLTFSNLHIVQVGKSNELVVNDVEPCCGHRCARKQVKPAVTKEEERLKENSTPDEAAGVAGLDSAFLTKALKESEDCLSTLPTQQHNTTLEEFQRNKRRIKEVLDVEYGMPLIRKQGFITGVKCETVMKKMEKLQEDGRFEAHEKYASAILEYFASTREDPDMKATLIIERGMAFYYANDLQKCKQYFNIALRMGNSLVNRELLEGRALVSKAAVYRREKKLNKALRCLQRAELLLLHHESGEDKADLYYNYGNLWLDCYSIKSSQDQGQKKCKEEAHKCFKKAIEFGRRDKKIRVQLRTERYSNLKIAILYLDSGSKASWITQPADLGKDVEEAEKHLDFVEHQLSDGMPLGPQVQFLMTRSDQHYRQGNLQLAREVAEEAMKIAGKLEKTIRMSMLRNRIELLQTMEDIRPPKYEPVITNTTDSGWSGDCSSSN